MVRIPGFIKRAPRVELRRKAVLVGSDGDEHQVVVVDISSAGFRLEVEETPRIGDLVTLRVEHGAEFPAQIRWALGNEAGGVFIGPVDYADWQKS